MWLEGYEYTDIEPKTGHSAFLFKGISRASPNQSDSTVVGFVARTTANVTSERLVKEYLDLYETCKDLPESQIRLQQILAEPLPYRKKACSRGKRATE